MFYHIHERSKTHNKKAETAWCFIISAGINMTEQRGQRRPVETNVLKADQLDPIHLSLGIVL